MGDQNQRVFRAKIAGRELLYISIHFAVHLFRPWIPSSTLCQHFLSSLGPFLAACTLRFSTFLDILRLICSVHGYPARRAASTADPDDPPRSWSTNYVVSSPAGQEATREPELAGFAWIAVLSWSGQSPIHVVESRRLLPLLGIESEPEVPARWPRPMPRNLDVNPRRSWLPRPRRWRTKRRSATF